MHCRRCKFSNSCNFTVLEYIVVICHISLFGIAIMLQFDLSFVLWFFNVPSYLSCFGLPKCMVSYAAVYMPVRIALYIDGICA